MIIRLLTFSIFMFSTSHLLITMKFRFLLFCLCLSIFPKSFGQSSCDAGYATPQKVVTAKDLIEWGKYPSFKLPFKIVYGGPRHNDSKRLPLNYGFTHLGTFAGDDAQKLLPQNRAILWGPLNIYPNSNWGFYESPWGNNTVLATKVLKDYMLELAS